MWPDESDLVDTARHLFSLIDWHTGDTPIVVVMAEEVLHPLNFSRCRVVSIELLRVHLGLLHPAQPSYDCSRCGIRLARDWNDCRITMAGYMT